jgi:hypothetical protein
MNRWRNKGMLKCYAFSVVKSVHRFRILLKVPRTVACNESQRSDTVKV